MKLLSRKLCFDCPQGGAITHIFWAPRWFFLYEPACPPHLQPSEEKNGKCLTYPRFKSWFHLLNYISLLPKRGILGITASIQSHVPTDFSKVEARGVGCIEYRTLHPRGWGGTRGDIGGPPRYFLGSHCNAPINSKHRHPTPRANPGYLNVFFARGVGNLIWKAIPGVGNLTLPGWGGEFEPEVWISKYLCWPVLIKRT